MSFITNAVSEMFSSPTVTVGTVLSLLGMVFTVMSFQAKNKKTLIIIQTIGSTFFFISYFFLGGVFGGIINSFYLLRNFIFLKIDSDKDPLKARVVCLLLCTAYFASYAVYTFIVRPELITCMLNLLPVGASIGGTIALTETKPVKIRIWKIPDSICWISYNTAILSLGGILCEIFNITSNTISIIRFRDKKRKAGEPESPQLAE